MARSEKPKINAASIRESGATGGAATTHGINYQYKFAVLQALKLIGRTLAAPHRKFQIKMEPRVFDHGSITRWDFAILGPEELTELKLHPRNSEIFEWLSRAERATSGTVAELRLVRSGGLGALITVLGRLVHIAREADSPSQFDSIVAAEDLTEQAKDIRQKLGENTYTVLRRLRIHFLPESVLDDQIEFFATGLAGQAGGRQLSDLIFGRVSAAAPERQTIDITDLIQDIHRRGIVLHAPPVVDPADLSALEKAAILILQDCRGAIAEKVLLDVLKPVHPLVQELSSLVRAKVVSMTQGNVRLSRALPHRLTDLNSKKLLAETLTSILRFIAEAPFDASTTQHVRNAIRLAKKVVDEFPDRVVPLFSVLHKRLKRVGDKHLVYEVVELTLTAAKRAHRNREVVDKEAQALICGRSWVYQRIGRVEDARVAGEKSLKLGQEIGSEKNTAFCLKCLGRMHRVEAEQETDPDKRAAFLIKSEQLLRDAISHFSESKEFGPNDPEIGDCYSLLGRTYLVSKNSAAARKAVDRAVELITDQNSKDYIDLLILQGDLASQAEDFSGAENYYREALRVNNEGDSERTEMRARAYLQLGKTLKKLHRNEEARTSLRKAAKIWTELHEPRAAAQAQLELYLIEESFSAKTVGFLRSLPPLVASTAVRIHKERVARVPTAASQRALDVGISYWQQLVREATASIAIHYADW